MSFNFVETAIGLNIFMPNFEHWSKAKTEKTMNQIKIIKRAEAKQIYAVEKITEQAARQRANEGLRKAASVVSDWIGELREQKQKDAETALAELFRFKSLSPDCRAC